MESRIWSWTYYRQPDFWGKQIPGALEGIQCHKEHDGDQWKMSRVKWIIYKFHCRNPEDPQHMSTLDFTNLPFHPILNLTDTPDTVQSDWATGCCTLDWHTLRQGGLWHPHCPSSTYHLADPNPLCLYHLNDLIGQSSPDYISSSYPTREVHPVLLYSFNLFSGTWSLRITARQWKNCRKNLQWKDLTGMGRPEVEWGGGVEDEGGMTLEEERWMGKGGQGKGCCRCLEEASQWIYHSSIFFWSLIMFQMLKKQKEAHRVKWVVIGGVSTRNISRVWELTWLDRHCIQKRSPVRVQRAGSSSKKNVYAQSYHGIPEVIHWQEPEEDSIEDPERICDECWGGPVMHVACKNRQKAYLPCAEKWIECMWDGELVTQCVPWKTGGLPNKRHWVSMLEVMVSDSDPQESRKGWRGLEWAALWSITIHWNILVGGQVGISMELVWIWSHLRGGRRFFRTWSTRQRPLWMWWSYSYGENTS